MALHYVYGLHAVKSLLKSHRRPIKQLLLNQARQDRRLQEIKDLAQAAQIPIELLSIQKLENRFSDIAHQGVVALTEALPTYQESDLKDLLQHSSAPALILILDGVTDPHNLGACLRTAEAAGVDFVISPKDNCAGITPVVAKVASGASDLLPFVRVTNLARAIDTLKQEGVWVYGAAAEADKSIYQLSFQTHTALVLGSEGQGLRRLTRETCDELFSLPMKGAVESLNVSVATGVALYEVLRQRL